MTEDASRGAAPALALEGVERRFGAVAALDGVSLDLGPGQFMTILGPSGSGKTTLLKVVAGFEAPDRGAVRLAGRDITFAAPAARGLGMVFQNYALFPHMSVAQNVAFPLRMRRMTAAAIARKTAEALKLVGLEGYEARLPRQLSGGQQQRVALARAIVFDPALLLLDEPFGALDRQLRLQMQDEVKRVQRRLGVGTLFVTHDQEEALAISDRIAVMNHGRIEQVGTPQEIYAKPANRFVAEFVGESNLLHGTVAGIEGGTALLRDGAGRHWRAPAAGATAGAAMAGLLRPERIAPLLPGQSAENRLSVEIAEATYLGDAVKLRLAGPDGLVLTARWPHRGEAPVAGTRLEIGWAAADMHLLSAS